MTQTDYFALALTVFATLYLIYRFKRLELYEKLSFIPLLSAGVASTLEQYILSLILIVVSMFCVLYMMLRLMKLKDELDKQVKNGDKHV